MLALPAIIITLSGISGAGGIALSAKSFVDSMNAFATNRVTQEQNERNVLRFQAVSDKLNSALEDLGKQRMVITKNFSVFIDAFERIHNKPEFTREESVDFPEFDINEIKNVSVFATGFLGATIGAIGGTALAAAAASGTTAAVMALGKASTGTKILELSGAAANKAALALLGGGSIATGGGGIALGTIVLNVASLGVGVLVEGIAMAYAGSLAKKHADKAKDEMKKNEQIIKDAMAMQLKICKSANDMRQVSVEICNKIYNPLVRKMKELIDTKCDWSTFTDEEKMLVENTILIVQILHYLNDVPLYKVTKCDDDEVKEVVSDSDEVRLALKKARNKAKDLEGNNGKRL